MSNQDFCELATAVIDIELHAISQLKQRINETFNIACRTLLDCNGRIVVMGMGKSGHIASKIAATLASTGSPAFFVHPGEASHGDMGMITSQDVVLAFSYSGKTEEICTIIPLIKRLGVPLISLTGDSQSPIASAAVANIDVSVEKEACPLGLAPTASSTASLVMGDALAIALLKAKGFTADDFALSHPGGTLGKRLLIRVEDIMHKNDAIPQVSENTSIKEALSAMQRFGFTAITNTQKQLTGIYTDGDIRRTIAQQHNIDSTPITTVMSHHPQTIASNSLAAEALNLMESKKITSLIVVNETQHIQGIVHMHDILKAGVI